MNKTLYYLIIVVLAAYQPNSYTATASYSAAPSSIKDKIICIDPGHGGTAETDSYRVGPTGEREEWVNLRVGLILKELLEDRGAKVIMTRSEDVQVTLAERAALAKEGNADLFISIHHNATADDQVNFPIIYFHGSANENRAGVSRSEEHTSEL